MDGRVGRHHAGYGGGGVRHADPVGEAPRRHRHRRKQLHRKKQFREQQEETKTRTLRLTVVVEEIEREISG